jgi:hypothetical protein
MATVAENLARLRTTAKSLPKALRTAILADGPAHVSGLIEILADDSLSFEIAQGKGFPPVHAVKLLADIKAPEAIDPMLRALTVTECGDLLHDEISKRLAEFGAPVLEPALAALAGEQDQDVRHALCGVLARIGVRDDRIFQALRSVLDEDVCFGAFMLADYGDPGALPILESAIENLDPTLHPLVGASDVNELAEAHAALGGVLPEAVQAKADWWSALAAKVRRETAEWEAAKAQEKAQAKPQTKVGRNDPCPCASGRKFKKCCLGKVAS